MSEKKGLEEAIKDKVAPLLEESMEKQWGITIPKLESELTDKLKHPLLQLYIPSNLSFSAAKELFKSEFLKRELKLHAGNVSQLAKILGMDRRSVHRTIRKLGIDIKETREQIQSLEDYQKDWVDRALRSTLDQYKEIIQPQKMEKMYQEVEHLSESIAKVLPLQEITWKEAEKEFERQFLSQALKENNNSIKRAADAVKIRTETLKRKMKKLRIEV